MSKIEELLRELCPDGVKLVPLEDIVSCSKQRIRVSEMVPESFIEIKELLSNTQRKRSTSTIPSDGTIIAFHDGDIVIGADPRYLGMVWLADCSGATDGDVFTVRVIDDDNITPKFLYYALSSERFSEYITQQAQCVGISQMDGSAMLQYAVPVPPLPVQNEIVRILDKFAVLIADIEDELESRKQQLKYYREKLLTFEKLPD